MFRIINNNQFSGPFLLPGTCVPLQELYECFFFWPLIILIVRSIEDCNFTSINFQTDIATYFNTLPSNENPQYSLKSVYERLATRFLTICSCCRDASRNALTEFPYAFLGNLSYIENNPLYAQDDVIFPNVKVLYESVYSLSLV